jgi:DNA-binding PadR family transcriptional regulator
MSAHSPAPLPALSLPEWLVLAVISQQPAHGFAVSQLTAARGELGRVWQVPKAVVYRALGRLADTGLVVPQYTEPGLGPQRTVYAAATSGRAAVGRWLLEPVGHVRDIRSELLLKLALLDRAGDDPAPLLQAQRAVLVPLIVALEARRARSAGFDAALLAWRRSTAVAALDFLDAVSVDGAEPASLMEPASRTEPASGTGAAGPHPAPRSASAKKRCGASS